MKLDRDNLIRARERLGYSIETVAEEAGIAKNSVLRAEHGEDIRPLTARKIAGALGVEVADLYADTEYPKGEAPPHLQRSFNGLLEEERRFRYLRSWRAFVWKLVHRWEADPPKTSREIAVVLDTMQALIDEGAFEQPPAQITTSDQREASEGIELQALFLGLQRLNKIADTVKGDETAQQRRELLKAVPGGLSA